MIRLLICLLILGPVSASGAVAAGPAEDFSAANSAYFDGRFDAAYLGYQKLLDDGHLNTDLLYNIGNASYRLGRPGEAALWYERALTMDPTHREARQNLRFLKRTGGIIQFESGKLDEYLDAARSDTLLRTATTAAWIAALGFAAALTLRLGNGLRSAVWIVTPAATLIAITAATGFYLKREKQSALASRSVVTAPGTQAFTAPARASSAVIDLPPGSQVAVVAERGNWRYIDLPGELRGWVAEDAIKPLWPYDPELAD